MIAKAMKELGEFKKKADDLTKKLVKAEKDKEREVEQAKKNARKERFSPEKERMKEKIARQSETINCLSNKADNLKKDYDIAKRALRTLQRKRARQAAASEHSAVWKEKAKHMARRGEL